MITRKVNLEANAMKIVAAGVHLEASWLLNLRNPDDRIDYCLGCSFLSLCDNRYSFYNNVDGDAPSSRDWGRAVLKSRPNSISSKLDQLAFPNKFLPKEKSRGLGGSSNRGPLSLNSCTLPLHQSRSAIISF